MLTRSVVCFVFQDIVLVFVIKYFQSTRKLDPGKRDHYSGGVQRPSAWCPGEERSDQHVLFSSDASSVSLLTLWYEVKNCNFVGHRSFKFHSPTLGPIH